MKYLFINLIILLVTGVSGYGKAHAGTLKIDSSMTKKNLCRELVCVMDPGRKLTIDDVAGREQEWFVPAEDMDDCSFGYSDFVCWFRINIENSEEHPVKWMLKIEHPLIDHLSFYHSVDGKWNEVKTGDRLPFSERPLQARTFVFPVDSPPGTSSCYLRMETTGVMHFAMTAFSGATFISNTKKETMLLWLYYGVMLALFFYNLIVFISSRDMSYLYLVLFVPCISVYSMSQNGIAFQYLWPESVSLAHAVIPVTVFFSCAMLLLFTRSFIETNVLMPRF